MYTPTVNNPPAMLDQGSQKEKKCCCTTLHWIFQIFCWASLVFAIFMYTKDPNKFDDAELVSEITATDLLEFLSGKDVKAGTYEFFDTTAAQMIKRSKLQTVITNGYEPENLIKAINGENVGTKVISK